MRILAKLALVCFATADGNPRDSFKYQKRQYNNATSSSLLGSAETGAGPPLDSIKSTSGERDLPSVGSGTGIGTGTAANIPTPTKVITRFTYLPPTAGTGAVLSTKHNASFTYDPSGSSPVNSINASFTYAPLGTRPSVGASGRYPHPYASNGTCNGTTVNLVSASLDWFYLHTYTQIDSTFLIQSGLNGTATGWTLLPATTSFDITDALAAPTCTSVTAFNSYANSTMLEYSCWETPTPVAAATTTIEQTAYKQLNQTSARGSVPDVVTSPSPAALTIDQITIASAHTPIVHFSQYEVVRASPSRQRDGHLACIQHTAVHTLNETFNFPYVGQDPNGTEPAEQGIRGGVHFAFLRAIGAESATPGTFSADPTVVVVVEKSVAATTAQTAGFAQPAPSLATPTPTLPSGLEIAHTTPTDTGTIWLPLSPRLESSEAALDVPTPTAETTDSPAVNTDNYIAKPFVAHVEGSDVTLDIAVNPTAGQSVVTALYQGHTLTATALAQNQGSGGGVGGLVAAVGSAAQQGNVAQVLSMAVGSNPTAAAIAGLAGAIGAGGGSSGNDQGGGSGSGSGYGSGSGTGGGSSGSGQLSNGNSGSSNANSGSNFGGGSNANPNLGSTLNSGSNSNGNVISGNGDSGFGGNTGSGGSAQQSPVLHIGSSEITGSMAPEQTMPALVLAGQTAVAGGAPITIDGTRISLATDGTDVFVGGSTTNIGVNGRPEATPILKIGDSAWTAGIVGTALPPALVFAGQTVSAGGSAVTIDGTAVSLSPDGKNVVVGGSTTNLAAPTAGAAAVAAAFMGESLGQAANIPLITVGSNIFTANAATQYAIGGSTLIPGGAIHVSGTTISLSPDASQVVVNGLAQQLSAPAITPAPLVTLGGVVYAPNAGSTYDIGPQHQLLNPGGQIVASGTTISLASDGSEVFMNGVAQSAVSVGANLATITAAPVLTFDGRLFLPSEGTRYIISGEILTPGGVISITNSDGGLETISLNSEAKKLITVADGVAGTSIIGPVGASPSGAPVITIAGKQYSAVSYNAGSGATYEVNGQSLTAGGSVFFTGSNGVETISLDAAGTAIVDIHSGTTSTSQISGAYGVLPTAAPILTIGGEIFTAVGNGATYAIDGETLTPGGGRDTVVINGHTYILSLYPHATMLEIQLIGADDQVISTTFETLFPATMTSTTITDTRLADGGIATTGATPSGASATASNAAGLANAASSSLIIELSGVCFALASLTLAVWL